MNLFINRSQIFELVSKQLNALFFLGKDEHSLLMLSIDLALEDCNYCFSRTKNKYYSANGVPCFNLFHSGQYTIFLYFLSRRIYFKVKDSSQTDPTFPDRIYYLNRALNSVDLFYEINMPKHFELDHPLGAVIGRAESIGNGFFFCQGCTVGHNKNRYPSIGRNVRMYPNSKILGNCRIGDNVICAANSYIKDQSIPSNSIVFGGPKDIGIKPISSLN